MTSKLRNLIIRPRAISESKFLKREKKKLKNNFFIFSQKAELKYKVFISSKTFFSITQEPGKVNIVSSSAHT